ncbi:alpha-adducin-like, partial [Tetranychus urticae]|uniref:alpha-adducin-like n=1 Tax=Tetranychus urticae TaxID=32264 RepID=UPI000D65528A
LVDLKSERKPKYSTSDTAVNGEEKLGDVSGASRSSKEGSPVKDLSEDKSSSKKDKKKKGIRTPSFLKKKKHKKEKELA